jgi:hypothetical protein
MGEQIPGGDLAKTGILLTTQDEVIKVIEKLVRRNILDL